MSYDSLAMTLTYRQIKWWKNAYHVYDGDERIGIVNKRTVRSKRGVYEIWEAHNRHFFQIKGSFQTRTAAAEAIPRGPIHQAVKALSGISG